MNIYCMTGVPYFYNCRDCEKELWSEKERKIGLCLHCFELRVQKTLTETTPIRCLYSMGCWNE